MKNNKTERVELKVLNYGKSSAKLLYTEKSNEMPSGEKPTTDYKLNIIQKKVTLKHFLHFFVIKKDTPKSLHFLICKKSC